MEQSFEPLELERAFAELEAKRESVEGWLDASGTPAHRIEAATPQDAVNALALHFEQLARATFARIKSGHYAHSRLIATEAQSRFDMMAGTVRYLRRVEIVPPHLAGE